MFNSQYPISIIVLLINGPSNPSVAEGWARSRKIVDRIALIIISKCIPSLTTRHNRHFYDQVVAFRGIIFVGNRGDHKTLDLVLPAVGCHGKIDADTVYRVMGPVIPDDLLDIGPVKPDSPGCLDHIRFGDHFMKCFCPVLASLHCFFQ